MSCKLFVETVRRNLCAESWSAPIVAGAWQSDCDAASVPTLFSNTMALEQRYPKKRTTAIIHQVANSSMRREQKSGTLSRFARQGVPATQRLALMAMATVARPSSHTMPYCTQASFSSEARPRTLKEITGGAKLAFSKIPVSLKACITSFKQY